MIDYDFIIHSAALNLLRHMCFREENFIWEQKDLFSHPFGNNSFAKRELLLLKF